MRKPRQFTNSIETTSSQMQTLLANLQTFLNETWHWLEHVWTAIIFPFILFLLRKKIINIFVNSFFSKITVLFTKFDDVKKYIVKLYEILVRLKPVIEFADTLIPDETKVQNKLDTVTPVVYNAIDKGKALLETIAEFLKIPLPTINSVGVNVDAVSSLKKSIDSI